MLVNFAVSNEYCPKFFSTADIFRDFSGMVKSCCVCDSTLDFLWEEVAVKFRGGTQVRPRNWCMLGRVWVSSECGVVVMVHEIE